MTTSDFTTVAPSESRFAFSKTTLVAIILLVGVIGIGFAPILVRLSEVGPTATGFWRVALSCPIFVFFTFFEKSTGTDATKYDYAWIFLAGVFFGADLATWHISIHYTTVANATLLCNLAPIIIIFWGWLVWKKPIHKMLWLGLGLIIVGSVLLTSTHINPHLSHAQLGDALAILTAFFYAAYFLTINNARHAILTNKTMAIATFSSSLTLGFIAWVSGEVFLPVTSHGWETLILLALLCQLLGQSLITFAMPFLSIAFSAAMLLIQPIVAALLSWWLFGEVLAYWQVFGMIITILGIYCAKLSD